MAFVPYQEAPAPPMTEELRRRCSQAVHLVTPTGQITRAGAAVLRAARELGWRKTAAVWSVPPMRWLLELGYQVVARNRRLFSRLLPKRQ